MLTLQKVAVDCAVCIGITRVEVPRVSKKIHVLLHKVLSTLFARSKRIYIDYGIGSSAIKLNIKTK